MTTHEDDRSGEPGLDAQATMTQATTTMTMTKKPRIITPIVVFCLAMCWMIVVAVVTSVLVAVYLSMTGALNGAAGAAAGSLIADTMTGPRWMMFIIALTALGNAGLALAAAGLSPVPLLSRLRLRATSWRRWPVGYLLAGAGMLMVGETAMALISSVTSARSSSLEVLRKLSTDTTPTQFALVVVLGGVLGPIGEELLFRGYLQTRFRERFGAIVAVVVTAVLFGIMHLDLVHSTAAMAMGLFAGWITERSGSIRPAIVAHVLNNTMAFVSARLSATDDADPQWWLSIVFVVVTVLLMAAMHWFFNKTTTSTTTTID